MSTERLREMLSEATPGPWEVLGKGPLVKRGTGEPLYAGKADARLIALAPDAIALLADFAQKVSEVIDHRDLECEGDCVTNRKDLLRAFLPLIERFDALCGDERA